MADGTLVRGRWVIPGAAGGALDDGAVLVRGGQVAGLGPWPDLCAAHPDARVIGSERFAVVPGLINAHHHSLGASALQHGIPDLHLEPWILAHEAMRAGDPYLDTLLSAAQVDDGGDAAAQQPRRGYGTPEAFAGGIRVRPSRRWATGSRH